MFKKILIAASIVVSTLASANNLAKTNGDFFVEKPIGGVSFIGCGIIKKGDDGKGAKVVPLNQVVYYVFRNGKIIFFFHMNNSSLSEVQMDVSNFEAVNLEVLKRQAICKSITVN